MSSLPRTADLKTAAPAALILACVLSGYLMLETARDALFLANMSPSRLPWVYLVIAALALVISQIERVGARFINGRAALAVTLVLGIIGTFAFWFVGVSRSSWLLGAFYTWTGVLITLVMLQFWSVLADRFAVQDAKRLFPLVAAGSTAGALTGSGLATVITRVGDDATLLLAACGAFVLAIIAIPLLPGPAESEDRRSRTSESYVSMLKGVAESPYAVRVGVVLVTSAVVLTLLDYVFKASVAEHIPPGELGAYFSKFYLYLNAASLVVQVVVARYLVDRLGVVWTALVLPVLLLGGAIAAAALGVFTAAVAMKSVDGVMRHTLHRTSQELMFVPMPDRVRQVLKPLADTLGHRGGQAVASVLILVVTQMGYHWRTTSVVMAVFALAWVVQLLWIRGSYLQVFRHSLSSLATRTSLDFPVLDAASVEELIAALDSPEDRVVLAALEILERKERHRLVSTLILHHPTDAVVERALALFVHEGSDRFVPNAHRRLMTASMPVQAAVVRAVAAVSPREVAIDQLVEWANDATMPAARIAAVCLLNGWDELTGDETTQRLEELIDQVPWHMRDTMLGVLAVSVASADDAVVERWVSLLSKGSPEVRNAALAALGGRTSEALVRTLIMAHGSIDVRATARRALLEHPDAFSIVSNALMSGKLPDRVRWELPETLQRTHRKRGAEVLLTVMQSTDDGMLTYRLLRALERLLERFPDALVRREEMFEVASGELDEGLRLLRLQLLLERWSPEEGDHEEHDLLVRLLHDRRVNTTERVVRMLGLGVSRLAVDRVFLGLRSAEVRMLSAAQELLEVDTPQVIRSRVLALVSQDDADQRLETVEETLGDPDPVETYSEALALAMEHGADIVVALAAAAAARAGLHELADRVNTVTVGDDEALLRATLTGAREQLGRVSA